MTEPPPRIRRDPRDPASMRARAPAAAPATAARSAERVLVENPACFILAVVDAEAGRLSRDDRDLMGAARQLADDLKGAVVLVACLPTGVEFRARLDQEGADRVALVRDAGFAEDLAEPRVQSVLAVAARCAARHILFSESFLGGELARRVAARVGDRPALNVRRLSVEGLSADIDAGLTEVHRPLPRVVVLARGAFSPVEPTPLREARAVNVEVPAAKLRVRSLGPLRLDPTAVPLGEAELIISAGDGLTDWDSFHRAANVLGAAEAGSRVVCDAGLLPKSRQVGASGLLIEPRCYMAFGIAGASQHLQGIAGAERVIAVNTDLRAEMVKRADLAIVADAQAVLPALVRRAAARQLSGAGAVHPLREAEGRVPPEGRGVGLPGQASPSPLAQESAAGLSSTSWAPAALPRQPHPSPFGCHPPRFARRDEPRRAEAAEQVREGQATVVALVSLGRHPVSKRARRADLDSRALELARGCAAPVTALHAGSAEAAGPVLRDYVGAGATQLVVVACSPEADPIAALEAHLRAQPPRLIVTGARAEAGECSGMVPFLLAERLGYGLATNVVAIDLLGDTARLVQALPGGKRRTLEAALPLVVTVDRTGPEPRLSARMTALRSVPDMRQSASIVADDRKNWSTKPSRPRPKRLSAPKALGQGAGSETDERREMIAPDPEAAAEAILAFLERDGLLGPSLSGATEEAKP